MSGCGILIPRARHSPTVFGWCHTLSVIAAANVVDIYFPSHTNLRPLEEPTLPDDEPAVHPLQENLFYPSDGHRL